VHARSMQATEEKSQTNSFAFRYRTEWEKNGGEEEEAAHCLARTHISTIVVLCMCRHERTRKKTLTKQQKKEKENKKKKQYKLQAKWSSSTDRATDNERAGKKMVDMCLELRQEENEKKRKGGENEEEESCTYYYRHPASKKKRWKSFLVSAACCCIIVDEDEVRLLPSPLTPSFLFFNKHVGSYM
jgi:hypothetical protein